MREVHVVIIVVALAAVAVAFAIVAILDRSRSVEHDLRRRTLKIIAALAMVPLSIGCMVRDAATATVAVVIMAAWTIVMVVAVRAVLRPPPDHRS